MRNTCLHKKISVLKPETLLDNTQIQWCKDCGATRYVRNLYDDMDLPSGQVIGKWKSPQRIHNAN